MIGPLVSRTALLRADSTKPAISSSLNPASSLVSRDREQAAVIRDDILPRTPPRAEVQLLVQRSSYSKARRSENGGAGDICASSRPDHRCVFAARRNRVCHFSSARAISFR
jgi:hypothetical protein